MSIFKRYKILVGRNNIILSRGNINTTTTTTTIIYTYDVSFDNILNTICQTLETPTTTTTTTSSPTTTTTTTLELTTTTTTASPVTTTTTTTLAETTTTTTTLIGTTTTTTTTSSPTTTTTTTHTPNCIYGTATLTYPSGITTTTTTLPPSQIFFGSVGGDLAILDGIGQTFTITFDYNIDASCNNESSSGSSFNSATTVFKLTTNYGDTWVTVDNITATVSGGSGSAQYDTQHASGTTAITGVTNINDVLVLFNYDCLNGKSGYGNVMISSVSVDFGSSIIVCDNIFTDGCADTSLSCNL